MIAFWRIIEGLARLLVILFYLLLIIHKEVLFEFIKKYRKKVHSNLNIFPLFLFF